MAENEKTGEPGTGAAMPPAESGAAGHPLAAFRQEMDRLFDDFFAGFPFGPGAPSDPHGSRSDKKDAKRGVQGWVR